MYMSRSGLNKFDLEKTGAGIVDPDYGFSENTLAT